MSSKLLKERTTSTRLKIGRLVDTEVKTVANWYGMSTAEFYAYSKSNELALTVGIHKTDDTIVCAQLAYLPGISAYSGRVTTEERDQLLGNTTEAHVVWVYTNPTYRNQGYYTEFADALKHWIFTNYSGYNKTLAGRIDTTQTGATYVKSYLASTNYTTPQAEESNSDFEKAELTRTQYETDNPS